MRDEDLRQFPSGRSVKRLKQDAKAWARKLGIPLHQALDQVALMNGGSKSWSESLRMLQQKPSSDPQNQRPNNPLALELGISDQELELLDWDTDAIASDDGLIYGFILTFDESCPPEILEKVSGLTYNNTVRVSANAFDKEPSPEEEELAAYPVRSDMNPYRKLLVLALNELLGRGHLSLTWDGVANEDTSHIETFIAGENTVIAWSGAGFGEVRISVWWKYDHSKHPQANLTGQYRERFRTESPLAKRRDFSKFVGAICSAWLERRDGKYLQGKGSQHLFETYARKGELDLLKRLPNPMPFGYEPEGKFHM